MRSWSDYQRHESRQATTLERQLANIENRFAMVPVSRMRAITGSGAGALIHPLGAKFVQEVNAVTIAVDALHSEGRLRD